MSHNVISIDNIANFIIENKIDAAKVEIDKLNDINDVAAKQTLISTLISNKYWKETHYGTKNLLEIADYVIKNSKFRLRSPVIVIVLEFLQNHDFVDCKWEYDLLQLLRILTKARCRKDEVLRQKLMNIDDVFLALIISRHNRDLFEFKECKVHFFLNHELKPCKMLVGRCYSTKWSFCFERYFTDKIPKRIEIPHYYTISDNFRDGLKFDKCFTVPSSVLPFLKHHKSIKSHYAIYLTYPPSPLTNDTHLVCNYVAANKAPNSSTIDANNVNKCNDVDITVDDGFYIDIEPYDDDIGSNRWSGTQIIPLSPIHTHLPDQNNRVHISDYYQ